MNSLDIERILLKNPITKKTFLGCFPANRLPIYKRYPFSAVINFDKYGKPGTHWVAMYVPNRFHVKYFDSFGLEGIPMINKFLHKNFYFLTKQRIPFQNILSDVCGLYAIYFIFMCSKNVPYKKIVRILKSQRNPDLYVKRFVFKYIAGKQ